MAEINNNREYSVSYTHVMGNKKLKNSETRFSTKKDAKLFFVEKFKCLKQEMFNYDIDLESINDSYLDSIDIELYHKGDLLLCKSIIFKNANFDYNIEDTQVLKKIVVDFSHKGFSFCIGKHSFDDSFFVENPEDFIKNHKFIILFFKFLYNNIYYYMFLIKNGDPKHIPQDGSDLPIITIDEWNRIGYPDSYVPNNSYGCEEYKTKSCKDLFPEFNTIIEENKIFFNTVPKNLLENFFYTDQSITLEYLNNIK
jgi:hypothetical protein